MEKMGSIREANRVLTQGLILDRKTIPGQFILKLPLDLEAEVSPGLGITSSVPLTQSSSPGA